MAAKDTKKKDGKGSGQISYINLIIEAGKANPSPPVGPALSQKGVQIMEFCKQFNAETEKKVGPIPIKITCFPNKSFTIAYKTQPASYLILKKTGIKKGAQKTGTEVVGSITNAQLTEIAEEKMQDLRTKTLDAAVTVIAGTARSMGIEVKG